MILIVILYNYYDVLLLIFRMVNLANTSVQYHEAVGWKPLLA
jgi:hypothetical protein